MGYKSLGGGGTYWDFEVNDTFEGEYVSTETGQGKHNSNLYHFRNLEDKEPVLIWGCAALDDKLEHAEAGQRYMIKFAGRKKSKSGTTYKDFGVMLWED